MIPPSPLRGRGDCTVEETGSDAIGGLYDMHLYIVRINQMLRCCCKICLHCDDFLLHLKPA
jgi:hypothetical protein